MSFSTRYMRQVAWMQLAGVMRRTARRVRKQLAPAVRTWIAFGKRIRRVRKHARRQGKEIERACHRLSLRLSKAGARRRKRFDACVRRTSRRIALFRKTTEQQLHSIGKVSRGIGRASRKKTEQWVKAVVRHQKVTAKRIAVMRGRVQEFVRQLRTMTKRTQLEDTYFVMRLPGWRLVIADIQTVQYGHAGYEILIGLHLARRAAARLYVLRPKTPANRALFRLVSDELHVIAPNIVGDGLCRPLVHVWRIARGLRRLRRPVDKIPGAIDPAADGDLRQMTNVKAASEKRDVLPTT